MMKPSISERFGDLFVVGDRADTDFVLTPLEVECRDRSPQRSGMCRIHIAAGHDTGVVRFLPAGAQQVGPVTRAHPASAHLRKLQGGVPHGGSADTRRADRKAGTTGEATGKSLCSGPCRRFLVATAGIRPEESIRGKPPDARSSP